MVAVAKRKRSVFGSKLRVIREAKGWTQAELGEHAEGMDQRVISRLEAGLSEPTWPTVLALADALGVTPDAFTGDEPKEKKPRRKK